MKKIGLLFAALFLLFLAAPTTASACICTKIYKPVCGANGKTYGNSCMAKCAKIPVKCAGKCPCKKPCPVFRLKKPAPGCKYFWYVKNGCKYPRLVCSCKFLRCKPGTRCIQTKRNAPPRCVSCPVFRLKKPAPGCKYVWYVKNGCKYPKLVCKARKPFCTKARCKLCNKGCLSKKAACYRRAKAFNLAGVNRVRAMCKRIRVKSGLWKCLCTWASRKASNAVILRGMRACYYRACAKIRCCKVAAKLCIPNVGKPGCRKLICSSRCK